MNRPDEIKEENMFPDFEIRYRFRWYGPCEEYGDEKEETIIRSDGSILIKYYDHHGPNGHFRLVKKEYGSASPEDVRNLYSELMEIVRNGILVEYIDDAAEEIIISQPGIKIEMDGGVSIGDSSSGNLVREFIRQI